MIANGNEDSSYKNDQEDVQEENILQLQQQNQSQNRQSKQMQKLELMKKCGFQNLTWINKTLSEKEQFILVGDLLIEINKYYNDIDYTSQICNLYLEKKRIVGVHFDKIHQLIEIKYEDKHQGIKDFRYIQARLINSQNQRNLMLAQSLSMYEQKMIEINQKYTKFFQENDEQVVKQIQQNFFEKMRRQLVENIMTKEDDFYSYLFNSFIEKNEMGFPIYIQQGINEASCALFGCETTQLIELLQRYGFVEQIFKRGFPRDMLDNEPFSLIFMMQNLEHLTSQDVVFDQVIGFMTVDGIYSKMRIIIKQVPLIYNGIIISIFYYSRYIIENSELFSGSNIYSSENIIDILLNQTIYSFKANQFGKFISNLQNYQDQSYQDIQDQKTCKYKFI